MYLCIHYKVFIYFYIKYICQYICIYVRFYWLCPSVISDIDARPWDFQAEECALRESIEKFNSRRYDKNKNGEFMPVDNCLQSVLGQRVDLPEDFHYSYEMWLEREVFSQPIQWEGLLQNPWWRRERRLVRRIRERETPEEGGLGVGVRGDVEVTQTVGLSERFKDVNVLKEIEEEGKGGRRCKERVKWSKLPHRPCSDGWRRKPRWRPNLDQIEATHAQVAATWLRQNRWERS